MTRCFLPDETRLSQVRLRTANLRRLKTFYTDVLGLNLNDATEAPSSLKEDKEIGQVSFSGGAHPSAILILSEVAAASPPPTQGIGLYHFALRYPDRESLARVVSTILKKQYPIEGASDHGVSEAVYLSDPDGNGVELYADRPREAWPRRHGQVEMSTQALDLESLLMVAGGAGEGPSLGHIHLHGASLEAARKFYHDFLGLAITQRNYRGALFFSAGGYHHHVGVNTWGKAVRALPCSVGLVSFRFAVPVQEILYCLAHRAPLQGYEIVAQSSSPRGGLLGIRDPDGNLVEVQA